jgi:PAS domain S-box-containing protein
VVDDGRSLRVLLVEDSDDDAALIVRQLQRYGFRPQTERVETAEGLMDALGRAPWDIVILDFSLPRFGALQAIKILTQQGSDTPVIVVSGVIGDERAVEAMRAGASDFIRKDNWARLGPAIDRELHEGENRRERRRVEVERTLLLAEREAERIWLRAVIDDSPVGIIRVNDSLGERVVANRRAEELFGSPLPPEGGVAQYVGRVLRPDGSARPRDDLAVWRALKGEIVTPEEELLRQPNGHEVRVLVSAAPIRLGDAVIGAVVAYQDITRLRELERIRDEWNSIIAHDLRQPVAAITANTQLLQRRLGPNLDEPTRRILERIVPAARALDRMVGDLLDSSRIEAQRLQIELEPIDLAALVGDVVDRVATTYPDHEFRVVVTEAIPTVVADPTRIAQVVSNLLSNAVKYGDPSAEIRVDVVSRDAEVEVAVSNRGAGIAPEELPRLFSRFYRTTRAPTERVEGLGLGLYISKGLVEAHGGRIWGESTPGDTTTFRFTLPVDRACRTEPG